MTDVSLPPSQIDGSSPDVLALGREVFYRVSIDQGLMNARLLFVSPQALDVTGYDASAFLEHPSLWSTLIHPDDITTVSANTARLVHERIPLLRRYRLRTRSGDTRWLEDRVAPILDARGAVVGYHGAALDVTDRLVAQSAATAARERLAEVLETGHVAYWEWHVAEDRVLYPRAWCQLMGLGDVERVADIAVWEQHLHEEDRRRVVGALHHALDGPGSRVSSTYRVVTDDGLELWLVGSWSMTRSATGEPSRVLGVEVDVTDHLPLQP